jgi:8-oxo-dGTP pyrophosphatase MutT (NUDIX family)
MNPRFQRHIDACNTAVLPGDRLAFRLAGTQVGWVTRDFAAALAHEPGIAIDGDVTLQDAAALPALAERMARKGHYVFRGEAFDVRGMAGGAVLSTIDRGALPAFGVSAEGVHVNGLVTTPEGLMVWVAKRAATKLLDPGKLDHIVGGGVSAGMDAWETLIKEAAEEAAIPATLAATAEHRSEIRYALDRDEGLRRDVLQCYDLQLPADFVPRAADGEVESFELWPIARVFAEVRDTDNFKFNVSLVLIDLFARLGMV